MKALRPLDIPVAALGFPIRRPTFGQIYEDHFAFVWRNARRLGAPEGDLDDVVQEIFVIASRRLAEFEGRSSVRTWLFGILLNVVRGHRRTIKARHPHTLNADSRADPSLLVDLADGPHELATKAEAARLVDRFLETLDHDKRAAVSYTHLTLPTTERV